MLVFLKFRLHRFFKAYRFSCDYMHERTALRSRKHRLVDGARELAIIRENEATARPAQRLMGGRGHHVRMGEGAWMRARGNKARDMRHIDHELGTHAVCDRSQPLKIDSARIGRGATHDELRSLSARQAL